MDREALTQSEPGRRVTRRRLLRTTGLGALGVVVGGLLAACGGGGGQAPASSPGASPTSAPAAAAPTTAPAAAPTSAPAAAAATAVPAAAKKSGLKVALVATQKFGDKGPMDDMKDGFQRAQKDFGVEIKLVESSDAARYESDIRGLAQAGYNMVIATFLEVGEPLKKVAPEFPKTAFVNIFANPAPGVDNLRTVEYEFFKGTYLNGIVAGMLTKSNKLGYIGGANIPPLVADYNSYVDGIKSVNQQATAKMAFAKGFEDPAGGKEIALAMYDEGIDIIITDAAKTTLGIIEAAKAKGKFYIGDSADTSTIAPQNYITATLLYFGQSCYDQIKALVDGTFKGGHLKSGLQDNIVAVGSFDSFQKNGPKEYADKIPQVKQKIDQVKADIIAGKITVNFNTQAPTG
jgi:basic membrane protein A